MFVLVGGQFGEGVFECSDWGDACELFVESGGCQFVFDGMFQDGALVTADIMDNGLACGEGSRDLGFKFE